VLVLYSCSYCSRAVYMITRRAPVRHAATPYSKIGTLILGGGGPHRSLATARVRVGPLIRPVQVVPNECRSLYCNSSLLPLQYQRSRYGTVLDQKPVRHAVFPEASATSRYEISRTSTVPRVGVIGQHGLWNTRMDMLLRHHWGHAQLREQHHVLHAGKGCGQRDS
jgi:hypothetical protein